MKSKKSAVLSRVIIINHKKIFKNCLFFVLQSVNDINKV